MIWISPSLARAHTQQHTTRLKEQVNFGSHEKMPAIFLKRSLLFSLFLDSVLESREDAPSKICYSKSQC
jgi:hypothetical protein